MWSQDESEVTADLLFQIVKYIIACWLDFKMWVCRLKMEINAILKVQGLSGQNDFGKVPKRSLLFSFEDWVKKNFIKNVQNLKEIKHAWMYSSQ